MTTKELEQLLRRAKQAPEFGGDVQADCAKTSWMRVSRELGFSEEAIERPYTLSERLDYVRHVMGQHVMRPLTIGVSVFAVMLSGWVTTVNASFDSVPGDILYPVKLVTERMQITFAPSSEQRARLHAEFAGRRLQEVVEISTSTRGDKETLVKAAVAGFKQELSDAKNQLSGVSPEQSTNIALVLDRKTDEYEAVIAQSSPSLSDVSKESVAEALVAVEEADSQAVDVLVQSHEATQEPLTAERLQQNFQKTYQDIQARVALDTARIGVLEKALKEKNVLDEGRSLLLKEAQDGLLGHEKAIGDAMDALAIGGYRHAFELLDEVSASIDASEAIIVPLEIELSTVPTPEEPVSEPETPAEETESVSSVEAFQNVF